MRVAQVRSVGFGVKCEDCFVLHSCRSRAAVVGYAHTSRDLLQVSGVVTIFTITCEHTINKPVKELHTETIRTHFWTDGD